MPGPNGAKHRMPDGPRAEPMLLRTRRGLEPRVVLYVPCDVLIGKEHTVIMTPDQARQWAGMLTGHALQVESRFGEMLQAAADGEDVEVTVEVEDDASPGEG